MTSATAPAAPSKAPRKGRRELWLRVASGLVLGAGVLAGLVYGGWPFAGIWLAAGIVGKLVSSVNDPAARARSSATAN